MGIVILYGVGIHDALESKDTTTEELEKLLEHSKSVLKQQGDLRAALKELEAEIDRRMS